MKKEKNRKEKAKSRATWHYFNDVATIAAVMSKSHHIQINIQLPRPKKKERRRRERREKERENKETPPCFSNIGPLSFF